MHEIVQQLDGQFARIEEAPRLIPRGFSYEIRKYNILRFNGERIRSVMPALTGHLRFSYRNLSFILGEGSVHESFFPNHLYLFLARML